jgi:hypothetical protein
LFWRNRLNIGHVSFSAYVDGAEALYDGNIFGASPAERELVLNDDTAQLLAAENKVVPWAVKRLRDVSKFIPSDRYIARAEQERMRLEQEDI